jgi:hypothetical protein
MISKRIQQPATWGRWNPTSHVSDKSSLICSCPLGASTEVTNLLTGHHETLEVEIGQLFPGTGHPAYGFHSNLREFCPHDAGIFWVKRTEALMA